VITLALADGTPVEVWYPAAEGTTGSETYDLRDHIPEAIRALLTADVPAGLTYPAGRDAEAAEGRFPLVLFSHGFSGVRMQSTILTTHLASWGMIVVSPEHASRNLAAVLAASAPSDPQASVNDLTGALDLALAADGDATSTLHEHVDSGLIAAVGHSAGGGTVLRAAVADDRITGFVSLASGALGSEDGAAMPTVPSFFIAGSVDAVVSPDETTRPAFAAATSPSLLWVIEGAGHNAFDDFCTFGNGTGIIGLAEASGLGPVLDSMGGLRALGEDGCIPPALDVDVTFPIINHAVTSWLRALFGIDAEAVGIGPEVADLYATPVVIEQR
jgi:predicted dienelactone hydrolase